MLEEAREAVAHACGFTANVEFSPMDATRSDREYLCDMVEAVIDCGATTVNIPDTVGYAIPEEFGELIAYLFEQVKNIIKAVISVHCHNDLGLAVANSLAAVRNGARQVECTINGIGERAGNAAMEEVVMAIATRKDLFGLGTGIRTENIYQTSPASDPDHGRPGAAEQGHCGGQCLCPRIRHPPGRAHQGEAHLRDHDPAVRGHARQQYRAGQALRHGTPSPST